MGRTKSTHRNAMALAQQERQSTEQVTKSQSLTLVKNLIRVSISTVCHLRNIFPGSCFQERSYAGMRIYQLDAASRDASTNETIIRNQQAYMLTKWLESGVFEAVERRYLRRMEFIILSPELNNPREAYSFELDYPEDENDHSMMFSGTKVTNVESTKGQLVKLIRSLIQFSNTLEELPKERVINIKLWYFDERTPPGWEPKHFEAADPSDLCFRKEADHHSLRVRIGELRTPHHTLKVQFRGIDTTLDGEGDSNNALPHDQNKRAGKGIEEGGNSESNRRAQPGNLLSCEAGPKKEEEEEQEAEEGEEDEDEEVDDEEREEETPTARDVSRLVSGMMTHLDVAGNEHSEDTDVDESTSQGSERSERSDSVMDAARTWTKKQARPTIKGLESKFEISRDQARECMERMVKEGLLTKANYRYNLTNPPAPDTVKDTKVSTRNSTREDTMMDTIREEDGIRSDHGGPPSPQSSAGSDDSETQAPELSGSQLGQCSPQFSMPPPPAPGRREGSQSLEGSQGNHGREGSQKREGGHGREGGNDRERRQGRLGGQGGTPDNRSRTNPRKDFATPPIPDAPSQPSLQPVPEKPAQAMMLSMGTKRVLDETVLEGGEDAPHSDPIDMFHPPPTGTMGTMSTLGYEVSLSQASSVDSSAKRVRKCSLAVNPIRQSKKLRMNEGASRRS